MKLYLLNWSRYSGINLDLLEEDHILKDRVHLNGTAALNNELAAIDSFTCYFETSSGANGTT